MLVQFHIQFDIVICVNGKYHRWHGGRTTTRMFIRTFTRHKDSVKTGTEE